MNKLVIKVDSRKEVSKVYLMYLERLLNYGSCEVEVKCKTKYNVNEFFI